MSRRTSSLRRTPLTSSAQARLDVLGLHEFDSVRKRMSVVIRFPNNAVKVLVKGADSSMLNILNLMDHHGDLGAMHSQIRRETENHLNVYSSQGLRTLVVASWDLNDLEFEEWQDKYEDASTSLTDRSAKLRHAAALILCNLNLLGATGIEDKLQEGVPEAIESLRQAGIMVWVLTGDKQETAISIGLSCKLLTQNMQQIVINGTAEDECRILLAEAKAKYGIKFAGCSKKALKKKKSNENIVDGCGDKKNSNTLTSDNQSKAFRNGGITSEMSENRPDKVVELTTNPLALIIDGNSLVYILEKDLEAELFDLAISCHVVLCCRVAPLQKAGIVDLIKSRTNDMTLAIGDDGRCGCWDMWSRRPSSSDGIRFCYGAVSFPEKIAPCAWTLELPACGPFGSIQLLSQCCFCANVVLMMLHLICSLRNKGHKCYKILELYELGMVLYAC